MVLFFIRPARKIRGLKIMYFVHLLSAPPHPGQDVHHHMVENQMNVLRNLHIVNRHMNVMLCHGLKPPAAVARERDGLRPRLIGIPEGANYVL